ncbi:MAG: IS1595 family transposase [Proteobacteria bacterium]|nr:IS1595 family transposase [Pseudomonadota bacterium]
MTKQLSVLEFFKDFPDDDACLEHLMVTRFGKSLDCPKCGKNGKFHRVKKRPVYACQWCSYQISPMADTPFHRSSTPLQKWFYAMYLFTTSRHGVPAKELQRQLSVTYKTAWRMGHEIRKYMADVDGDSNLSGHVEIDETYIGGKDERMGVPNSGSKKTAVFGMIERGGDVITRVIPKTTKANTHPLIKEFINKGSTISSDEWPGYMRLKDLGYTHGTVRHTREQYVNGIHHTNSMEGYWSRIKNSIRGTHVHVSKKHLQKYLGEFEYRYNMRANPSLMFDLLLRAFASCGQRAC